METYSLILNSAISRNRQYAIGVLKNDITYYVDWNFLPTEFSKYEVSYHIQTNNNGIVYSQTNLVKVSFGATDVVSQNYSPTSIVNVVTQFVYNTNNPAAPKGYFSSCVQSQANPIVVMNYPTSNYVRVQFTFLNNSNVVQNDIANYVIILTFTPVKN